MARSYDRVATVLSLGQDPRWRRALVAEVGAIAADTVLDIATGTGLVAAELRRRYGCRVVGLDQSEEMLAIARSRDGVYADLIHARAEHLPFEDASVDHATFAYLLRYVDDPGAVLREIARVVRPGGRVAALDFGVPRGLWYPLWWLYTRIALPLLGRLVSRRWSEVGAFLGPNIESFDRRYPRRELERMWRDAGLVDVRTRVMSVGGGVVMSASRAPAAVATDAPLAPAFYALRSGGWRDYWTLLHPPYTAWHLSYVLLGAALASRPDPLVVAGMLVAFGLAVGVAAHAFDELRGRPLATRIPSRVLVALGSLALVGSLAIAIAGVGIVGPGLLAFAAVGAALVLLYALEAPLVHTDAGFAVAWGAFPVLTAAYATGAAPLPAILAASAAALLSAAQRELSTRARSVRRRVVSIDGEIVFRDGRRERVDASSLIGAPESALRLLWLALLAASSAMLLARWL